MHRVCSKEELDLPPILELVLDILMYSMGPSRASTHHCENLFSLRMSTFWSNSVTEPIQN
jgi:hypothetical protein